MDVSRQEKLTILLDQIQLPTDMKEDFVDAELRKLQIYKKSKIWHFHVEVKDVLPVTTYQVLNILHHTGQILWSVVKIFLLVTMTLLRIKYLKLIRII